MSLQSEFARIAATDGRAALVTVISGSELGAKLLVRSDGSTDGSLGSDELDCEGRSAAEELLWAERSEIREAGDTTSAGRLSARAVDRFDQGRKVLLAVAQQREPVAVDVLHHATPALPPPPAPSDPKAATTARRVARLLRRR